MQDIDDDPGRRLEQYDVRAGHQPSLPGPVRQPGNQVRREIPFGNAGRETAAARDLLGNPGGKGFASANAGGGLLRYSCK